MNQRLSEALGMKQARRMMAADWLQRVNSDTATDEELKDWLEWYSKNEDNRRAFDQADAFFRTLRTAPPSAKDALRKLAAAKAAETTSQRPRAGRSLLPWSIAAVVALGLAGALAGWQWPGEDLGSTRSYQTSRGEHRKVELPDGSIAVIGAQSALELTFDASRRFIRVVSGETYFQVKRDPLRPFVVHAGPAQVTALGTAFDVHRSGDRVTVAVIEGAVEVSRAAARGIFAGKPDRLRIGAGERAVLAADSPTDSRAEMKVTPIDPATAVAWQSGQLSFSGEPLHAVIASVNRYSKHQIAIGDADVAGMTFTGTVLPDRVEEWVVNLAQAFPLQAVSRGDGTFVLLAKDKNSR